MKPEERVIAIRRTLEDAFAPEILEIEDKSHEHAGHKSAGGMGHYTLRIKSKKLDSMSLLQKHQVIYKALGDLMQTEIHALSIKILT